MPVPEAERGKVGEISALLPSQETEEQDEKAMKRQCVDSTPAERLEVDTAYSSLQLQRRNEGYKIANRVPLPFS